MERSIFHIFEHNHKFNIINMANWNKLNKEFDDAMEHFDEWASKRDRRNDVDTSEWSSNISSINGICSYCGGVYFQTIKSQYKDADGDYDDCNITYCVKCRNTFSIKL